MQEWLEAKGDPEREKVIVNTVLGKLMNVKALLTVQINFYSAANSTARNCRTAF